MSRAPIFIRVWRGHLVPADAYAQQQIDELGEGKEFNARLSRITATGREEREGMRGLWFAGLALLSQNTEDKRYDTPENAYYSIMLDLGYCRPRWRRNGSVEMVPISTSDGSMSDEEMSILQERAREFWMRREGYDPWQTWQDEQTAKKANEEAAKAAARGRR